MPPLPPRKGVSPGADSSRSLARSHCLLCSAFPSRLLEVVPTPGGRRPAGLAQNLPVWGLVRAAPSVLRDRQAPRHPPCLSSQRGLFYHGGSVVLGSEARHECVCPSSSRPGPGAISSPIWRPRSGIQWPQVSRWVPKGPGRPGGWIKAVGEGVALDDLMRGDDPCSGGETCGLGLGTDSLSLCLCPRSVLDAGVRPRLMHARLQAPEKGSLLPTALQPGGRGGGGTG